MDRPLITGIILGALGITVFSCVGQLASSLTELAKSRINIEILKSNIQLDKMSNCQEQTSTRAIGFATTFEEDEEDDI